MDFLVIGLDRPDGGRRRQDLRLAHLEYVADKQDRLKYGGPILDGDGRATGSVLILGFADRAALDAHLGGDRISATACSRRCSSAKPGRSSPRRCPGNWRPRSSVRELRGGERRDDHAHLAGRRRRRHRR